MGRKQIYGARRNVTVYLTDEEYEMIKKKAQELNTSVANILHEILMNIDKEKEGLIDEVTKLKANQKEEKEEEEENLSLDDIADLIIKGCKRQGLFEEWSHRDFFPVQYVEKLSRDALERFGKDDNRGNVTRVKNKIVSGFKEWKAEKDKYDYNELIYSYTEGNEGYPSPEGGELSKDVNKKHAQSGKKSGVKVMPK